MKRELEKIAYMYGDMNLKKQRKKRQKLLVADLCLDYAKNSTLHGLRYTSARELTTLEKVFWLSIFLASLGMCSYLIHNVYVKWTTSPVIVSMDEKLVSAGSVPFPAVTICPQIKTIGKNFQLREEINIYQQCLEDGTEYYAWMTPEELKDMALICNYNIPEFMKRNNTFSIHNNMYNNSIRHVHSFQKCYWQDSEISCEQLLYTITAEGLCFTWNGLISKEIFRDTVSKQMGKQIDVEFNEEFSRGWSIEKGYSDSRINPYPKRGNDNRASPDLKLVLKSLDKNRDPSCNELKSGFDLYLHHPADWPQASLYHYSATYNQVTSLAVSVHVQSTAATLDGYAPEVRQCYLPNERYLRHFKIYTAKNCELECLSNITYDRCGCVGFYLPHETGTNICAENKLQCMREARAAMERRERDLELGVTRMGCGCLPTCYDVQYDAEVLKTDFVTGNYKGKSEVIYWYSLAPNSTTDYIINETDVIEYNISVIEIYFKKSQYMASRRSELFGTTDFLANIGGLLGVFLGFSFLSFIEIIYYLTFRVGLTLKRDIEQEKTKRSETNATGEKRF